MVRAQHPVRVVRAGGRGELEPVDRVAAVGGQLDAVPGLGQPGPRLGELAGQPADLDDGHARAVGQHDCHLQDRLQLGPDRVGLGAGERLGAVSALQHERLAPADRGQPVAEQVALAGEDQRRQPGQLGDYLLDARRVGPVRLLRAAEPARVAGQRESGPEERLTDLTVLTGCDC